MRSSPTLTSNSNTEFDFYHKLRPKKKTGISFGDFLFANILCIIWLITGRRAHTSHEFWHFYWRTKMAFNFEKSIAISCDYIIAIIVIMVTTNQRLISDLIYTLMKCLHRFCLLWIGVGNDNCTAGGEWGGLDMSVKIPRGGTFT